MANKNGLMDSLTTDVLNEQEFLDLMDRYRNEFYRFAYCRVWNPSDVEDVFAEAVMVAWKKRHKFQVGTNFRAWFYRILLNKSFVANRQAKRYSIDLDAISELDEAGEDHQAFAGRKAFLEQIDDNLLAAFRRLRQPQRTCLLLRARDSCSYREIANRMDIPVGTVMTHLARGRKHMRHLLREVNATPAQSDAELHPNQVFEPAVN